MFGTGSGRVHDRCEGRHIGAHRPSLSASISSTAFERSNSAGVDAPLSVIKAKISRWALHNQGGQSRSGGRFALELANGTRPWLRVCEHHLAGGAPVGRRRTQGLASDGSLSPDIFRGIAWASEFPFAQRQDMGSQFAASYIFHNLIFDAPVLPIPKKWLDMSLPRASRRHHTKRRYGQPS